MYDFIAIGETTIDAFIKLGSGSHYKIDKEKQQICLPFATKIPYESVAEIPAVGNASNASVSASRLGLRSALVANVGKDDNGEKCIEALQKEKVSTEFIKVNDDQKTNYHYILWYEEDRTILQKHSAFHYTLPDIGEPKWIYLTSVGENSHEFHAEIAEYLETHPSTKLAFQPGIFQIKLGKEKLAPIYKQTEIFFCNVEEAEEILGINTLGIQELLKRMRELGSEIVVITDGVKGAYAYDGTDFYTQAPYRDPKPPFERTGAGDAFASTVVSALALGQDLTTALKWGAINSMSVVQYVGAQEGLLSREKIEEYLKKAPSGF